MTKKRKNPFILIIKLPSNIWQFIKEAKEELKKVSWPSRETAIKYTTIVVVSSLITGFAIGGFDYFLSMILEYFIV